MKAENLEICFNKEIIERITESMRNRSQGNLPDALALILRTMVMDGTFAAGYKFPNEHVMSGLLKTGRGVIREAYKELAMHNFIVRTKNGTTVNSSDSVTDNLSLSIMGGNANFSDVQEYRSMLEVETARHAAVRADSEDIKKLTDELDKMAGNEYDSFLLARHDTRFHLHIAEAAKNILMLGALHSSRQLLNDEIHHIFSHDKEIRHRAIVFHRRILEAIIQKNPVAASMTMEEHMHDVGYSLAYLRESSTTDVA